jgi:Ca2+-transporting ATPase
MNNNQIDGLSSSEVVKKQKKFGYNELPNQNRKNALITIISLITEPMIFLLFVTVVIYFFLGDKGEAFLLLASFIGIIGIEFYQDSKTEKSLEALKNLSSPISVVIRNGAKLTIPGRELVVGDIVLLSEGSRIPADAKLISVDNFEVDESLLTGESVPVAKRIGDVTDLRLTSVYSGTLAVKGHAVAEVTGVGLGTEIGEIGRSLNSIETEKTLLQKEVNKVIKLVATIAISSSILLALVYWLTRGDLIRGLLSGLTLSIAILPEEFPVVLTVFLTLGAWRLAKNNILTRRSHMIETLGSATVLCVDKTGTLTENQMRIASIVDASGIKYSENFIEADEVVRFGVLASQKQPFDPMEEAFILTGQQVFHNIEEVYEGQNIIREYPVEDDSLSVVHVWGTGNRVRAVALKGAPETVFNLCHLDRTQQSKYDRQVKYLAGQGLRVIAVGKGKIQKDIPDDRHDFDFEFLGLVGLADPIRKEVIPAIRMCRAAGIKVVMLTGDYPETAARVAKDIGLDCRHVMTGAEFELLSPSNRRKVVKEVTIFSRVRPAHKLIIVNALKRSGEVVVMTGDGVNDAPALKSAHVGIAMGEKGTDVAREAAGIVLLDDNFASIVQGVRIGRRIYDNLQKAMSYIISVHIPIALLSLLPVFFKWPIVLIPAHIVFLEFIIDPSSTIIFENEKERKDIMDRPPRKLTESMFNRKMVIGSLIQGLFVAIIVVAAFGILLALGWGQDKARGLTFLILVVANIFLTLGISGRQALSDIFHFENKSMAVILLTTAVALVLVFSVPFLRELFHFSPLSAPEIIGGVLIGAVSILGILPLKKLINRIF